MAIYAFFNDWGHLPVFVIMALVAFMFLGAKKDIPDETWSPQQKGAWAKRYTTLRINDGEIIYVAGESSNERESYSLAEIDQLQYRSNKIFIYKNGSLNRKINCKYWNTLQRQNTVGLSSRGVNDNDVERGFWQQRRFGGPSPQS
ncbi:MAG: hypothetical protein GY792_32305 [Gammaproteobacteria bacterium]|nr:hypothetical protein [Gammaproteobacteria bacterium]